MVDGEVEEEAGIEDPVGEIEGEEASGSGGLRTGQPKVASYARATMPNPTTGCCNRNQAKHQGHE